MVWAGSVRLTVGLGVERERVVTVTLFASALLLRRMQSCCEKWRARDRDRRDENEIFIQKEVYL